MYLLLPLMSISIKRCDNHPVMHFLVSPATMSGGGTFIGDQLILEEEYDENYIPSEQGTWHQLARLFKIILFNWESNHGWNFVFVFFALFILHTRGSRLCERNWSWSQHGARAPVAGQGRHCCPLALTMETLVRTINHLGELAETGMFVLLTRWSEGGMFMTPKFGVA